MLRLTVPLLLALLLTLVGFLAVSGQILVTGVARELLMGIASFLLFFALHQIIPAKKVKMAGKS